MALGPENPGFSTENPRDSHQLSRIAILGLFLERDFPNGDGHKLGCTPPDQAVPKKPLRILITRQHEISVGMAQPLSASSKKDENPKVFVILQRDKSIRYSLRSTKLAIPIL